MLYVDDGKDGTEGQVAECRVDVVEHVGDGMVLNVFTKRLRTMQNLGVGERDSN